MKTLVPVTVAVAIAASLASSITLASPLQNAQATQNVWNVISANLKVDANDQNAKVQHWVKFYTQNPGNRQFLEATLKRATPYIRYIYQQVQKRHMPARFALLPIVESSYKAVVVSHAGAAGLWQLMSNTATNKKMGTNYWNNGRLSVTRSTNFALNYLVQLKKTYDSWDLAAAAYNAGPGTIAHAIASNKRLHKATDFFSLHLPKQTENYVPKLRALAIIMKNPAHYGIKVPLVANKPFFKAVKVKVTVSKTEVAHFANIRPATFHKLNPNIRRNEIRPNHSFTLLIPSAKVAVFNKNYTKHTGQTPQVKQA